MIGYETIQRIVKAVRQIERDTGAGGGATEPGYRTGTYQPRVAVLRITSSTATSGKYPAVIRKWESETQADIGATVANAVWVLPLQSETYVNNDIVSCLMVYVQASDGKAVFVPTGSGGTPAVGKNYIAKIGTGGIAARSGATVASVTCTLYNRVTATLTSLGITKTVWNPFTFALEQDAYTPIVQDTTGDWWATGPAVLTEDC